MFYVPLENLSLIYGDVNIADEARRAAKYRSMLCTQVL
jgi:hypothetical protein